MPKTRKIGTSETSGDWVCAWASWIHALDDWQDVPSVRLPEFDSVQQLNVDLPSPGARWLTRRERGSWLSTATEFSDRCSSAERLAHLRARSATRKAAIASLASPMKSRNTRRLCRVP